MTIRAYVIPNTLVCAECGYILQNVTRSFGSVLGKALYECGNGSCSQFGQPHWYHFPEAYLDDKGGPQ